MSKAFDTIQKGLQEALDYAQGNEKGGKVYHPSKVDVKAIRKKAQMTQNEFAATFGISLGTLRHWERGDRIPRGPALVLLHIIDKSPQTVLNLLS